MLTPGVNIPAADLRAGFRTAMSIGALVPPTFIFPQNAVTWDDTEHETPDPVSALCAYEGTDNSGQVVNFGVTTPTRVTVTILDEEYEQIKGCTSMIIGEQEYLLDREDLPYALGTVHVHTLRFTAADQSPPGSL